MNNLEKMWTLAKQAFDNAYCPYSKFAVGACIRTPEDKYYIGCDVENVAYPDGTCAETGAISAMAADGGRKIAEILIIADGSSLITPCGACRQRIIEFADKNTLVHLADLKGIQKTLTIAELLPYSFTDEKLTHD